MKGSLGWLRDGVGANASDTGAWAYRETPGVGGSPSHTHVHTLRHTGTRPPEIVNPTLWELYVNRCCRRARESCNPKRREARAGIWGCRLRGLGNCVSGDFLTHIKMLFLVITAPPPPTIQGPRDPSIAGLSVLTVPAWCSTRSLPWQRKPFEALLGLPQHPTPSRAPPANAMSFPRDGPVPPLRRSTASPLLFGCLTGDEIKTCRRSDPTSSLQSAGGQCDFTSKQDVPTAALN